MQVIAEQDHEYLTMVRAISSEFAHRVKVLDKFTHMSGCFCCWCREHYYPHDARCVQIRHWCNDSSARWQIINERQPPTILRESP